MKIHDYPPQDALSPLGATYQQRIMALGDGVVGEEFSYGADPYQSLAVFRPKQASGEVLIFFHGGGWTNGYKEWMTFMAPALLAQGIVFVSAGYRLAPAHVFPVGLEDCADAVAWVIRNLRTDLPGEPRFFIGGHSAGGHYAALLAVTAQWRSQRGLGAHPLAGCLPVSGVYRFGADSGMAQRPRFLGPVDDGQAELAASPLPQLHADACPPFLLTYGSRDFPHLITQARQMETALTAAKVPVQVEILEDCDHFEASVACGDASRSWVARAAAWMRAPGR
jgi:arylformamidase